MPRKRPNLRRPNESMEVDWIDPLGVSTCAMTVTVGFDPDTAQPVEVFARAKKPGSVMDAMLDEGCVLISRDLQHGRTVDSLRSVFARSNDGRPFTPLGAVVDCLAVVSL